MYHYKCCPERVIDGDTVVMSIDVGFGVTLKKHVRLYGINTPELHDKDLELRTKAQAAKQFVIEWIAQATQNGHKFEIITILDSSDKYGRILGKVFETSTSESLNEALLNNGHAVKYLV